MSTLICQLLLALRLVVIVTTYLHPAEPEFRICTGAFLLMVCRKCAITETSAPLPSLQSHKPLDLSKKFKKPGDSAEKLEIL